jgi:hypothetical protein
MTELLCFSQRIAHLLTFFVHVIYFCNFIRVCSIESVPVCASMTAFLQAPERACAKQLCSNIGLPGLKIASLVTISFKSFLHVFNYPHHLVCSLCLYFLDEIYQSMILPLFRDFVHLFLLLTTAFLNVCGSYQRQCSSDHLRKKILQPYATSIDHKTGRLLEHGSTYLPHF